MKRKSELYQRGKVAEQRKWESVGVEVNSQMCYELQDFIDFEVKYSSVFFIFCMTLALKAMFHTQWK